MRRKILSSGAVFLLALLCAPVPGAQSPQANPFLGVWKLDPARSKLSFQPPAGYVSFRHYEDQGGGWLYHTIVNSSATGASFTVTAARYDGKEYPVYTPPQLGALLAAGTKTPRTVAFRKTGARTLEFTDRYNGMVSATGVCTVSADGKTLTITSQDFDRAGKQTSSNVFVYGRTA